MSLLASLAKASASFQQATENRASRQAAATSSSKAAAATETASNDDSVTLNGGQERKPSARLTVNQYKQNVGQDYAFVRETLRHKLAEYSLNPATRISVEKHTTGEVKLQALMPENTRTQIEKDLNNNKAFREAFNRLSVNEPTVAFVDTALRLNQAYGVSNSLLDQMVSENQQFNGLQDLVHRYDSLRQTVNAEQMAAAGMSPQYAFNLNARA
ncbi:hypothetical protein [Marinobacter sp. BGYM27]|uniref:hypothetical protein n=1 Tax=Marinobacter sp. BGYM27 TaxID=2975597 RepID=UPI0021A9085B|nr:hypothetical protein [Marinobacter sp. BGYM27]MDG5498693.1 hypothetical protein [Marinobacter sp. BGYM27]